MLPYPPFENHCIKKTRSKHIDVFRRLFADLGNPAGIWLDPSENNDSPLVGSPLALEKVGSLDAQRVVHQHQGWRLISCMWLHAGVFHVLANMLSLVFIGVRLEQEFGFVRIGFLYLTSGLGGSLLKYGISVGASGALFGLLGSMLSELISNWTMYVNKLAALLTLLFIIIINLAVGILPQVDTFAHIGGFVSGFLLGFLFLIGPQFKWLTQRNAPPGRVTTPVKSKHNTYQNVVWVHSLILLIVGYTLGLVTLFRGFNLNNHCSWCHYLSSIPTSKWNCKSQNIYCLEMFTRKRPTDNVLNADLNLHVTIFNQCSQVLSPHEV